MSDQNIKLLLLRYLSQVDIESRVLHVKRLKDGLSTTHPLRGDALRAIKAWLADRARIKPDTDPSLSASGAAGAGIPGYNARGAVLSVREKGRFTLLTVTERQYCAAIIRNNAQPMPLHQAGASAKRALREMQRLFPAESEGGVVYRLFALGCLYAPFNIDRRPNP